MFERLIRLIVAGVVLVGLWGYANSTGITAEVNEAAGVNIPTNFQIPFLEKDLAKYGNKLSPQRLALEAVKEAGKNGVPEKAVEAAIRAAEEAGVEVPDIVSAYEKGLGEAEKKSDIRLDISGDKLVVKPPVIKTPEPKPTKATPAPKKTTTPDTKYQVALMNAKKLSVKGRAPKTGYSRSQFGTAWTDNVDVVFGRNGCDTRNDILKRDLVNVKFSKGCKVASGVLKYEPYTGVKNIKFVANGEYKNQLDTEHLVALGDAWQKGAQQWSKQKRTEFANDPYNLLMVDPSSNRQKGDADAATWLPKNKVFRCDYIHYQVRVKKKYGVWVTQAEQDTMVNILKKC